MSQHFTHRNSLNALLCVIVATPACAIGYVVCNNCKVLSNLYLCDLAVNSPILFVNAVFFLNVCVLFWVISLIVNSTWLIDPYWTIIPPLIGLFYHFHPLSATFRGQESLRAGVALTLTFLWSIRLTHSYFRRENYQFGVREDWRFADMKKASPKSWWWTSFVSSQIFSTFQCVYHQIIVYSIFVPATNARGSNIAIMGGEFESFESPICRSG